MGGPGLPPSDRLRHRACGSLAEHRQDGRLTLGVGQGNVTAFTWPQPGMPTHTGLVCGTLERDVAAQHEHLGAVAKADPQAPAVDQLRHDLTVARPWVAEYLHVYLPLGTLDHAEHFVLGPELMPFVCLRGDWHEVQQPDAPLRR